MHTARSCFLAATIAAGPACFGEPGGDASRGDDGDDTTTSAPATGTTSGSMPDGGSGTDAASQTPEATESSSGDPGVGSTSGIDTSGTDTSTGGDSTSGSTDGASDDSSDGSSGEETGGGDMCQDPPGGVWVAGPSTAVFAAQERGAIAIAQLVGDDALDIVATAIGSNTVVLVGDGTGAGVPLAGVATQHGEDVAVADFDGQAGLDFAQVHGTALRIYLNTGADAFSTQDIALPFGGSRSIEAIDRDGDPTTGPDLVVHSEGLSGHVAVLENVAGTGVFDAVPLFDGTARGEYDFAERTGRLSVLDFDGDGTQDIVVPSRYDAMLPQIHDAAVFLANGLGGFEAPFPIDTVAGGSTMSTTVGNFDADPGLELVLGKYAVDHMIVVDPTGGGAYADTTVPTTTETRLLVSGDLDCDDTLTDLVFCSENTDEFQAMLQIAPGTFSAFVHDLPPGSACKGLAIGDLDDNGLGDIAVLHALNGELRVGTFLR